MKIKLHTYSGYWLFTVNRLPQTSPLILNSMSHFCHFSTSSAFVQKLNKIQTIKKILYFFFHFRLIEDFVRDLMLNNDHIHVMEQQMREAINMGLKKDQHENAAVKCFPTYVKELPNGKERG